VQGRNTNSVFRDALQRSGSSGTSTAGGSLPGVGFRLFALIVDLLGSCHRSRDSVQRDRVRFTSSVSCRSCSGHPRSTALTVAGRSTLVPVAELPWTVPPSISSAASRSAPSAAVP
jgi:hypothetical protein